MTITQILDYIQTRLDVNAQFGPGYEASDISLMFNKAQNEYVRRYCSDYSNPARKGLEANEKRSKDLVELKSEYQTIVFTNGLRNDSYFVDIPNNTYLVLSERMEATDINKCGTIVTIEPLVVPVSEDFYGANINNPFKKPYEKKVWRLDRERDNISFDLSTTNLKRQELILSSTMTPVKYSMIYYRIPKTVDLTNTNDFCEMSSMTHDVICDMTVEMLLQTTERQSLQTKMMENQSSIQ
jgi:hypothetical protein